MVDSITNQVNQRICQLFNQILINLRLLSNQLQFYFSIQLASQISYHTRKTTKDLAHRLHSQTHHHILNIGRQQIQVRYGTIDYLRGECLLKVVKTVTNQHQLANQIHHIVQPTRIHTNRRLTLLWGCWLLQARFGARTFLGRWRIGDHRDWRFYWGRGCGLNLFYSGRGILSERIQQLFKFIIGDLFIRVGL